MVVIEVVQQPVFYAKTKGRRYLTLRAAANAEARALLDKKYPKERAEHEQGRMIHPPWHWSSDEKLTKVHSRLVRWILRRHRQQRTSKGLT